MNGRKEIPMKINEELEQLLKNRKLRRILDIYDEQLRSAEKEDVSYTEFLTRLLRAQWHTRQEHALEWRIQRATLPERWSLDTFPFAHQPGVNRKQIRAFAELDFIDTNDAFFFRDEVQFGKGADLFPVDARVVREGERVQRPTLGEVRSLHAPFQS